MLAPLPAKDSVLAALLVTWGYSVDERQRIRLTKLHPAGSGDTDRVVKYPVSDLRRLVGSHATQQDLRTLLISHFEPPGP